MRTRSLAALLAASALFAGNAAGFAPAFRAERTLEVAKTAPADQPRAFRNIVARGTTATARQRADLLAQRFGTAGELWDADTGVPLRIWGSGISYPGAVDDASLAEHAAREVLADHLELLAPGSAITDWTLGWNEKRGDVRTVVFTQSWRGMPVLGGRIEMELKQDRMILIGSEALPNVAATVPAAFVDGAAAGQKAAAWVGSAYHAPTTGGAALGASVLPIIHAHGQGIDFHVVQTAIVDSDTPRGQWQVYTDAQSGEPLARHETLAFATGSLKFHVPTTYPQAGYTDRLALYANATVGGAAVTATIDGLLTWAGATAATVVPSVSGTYVNVTTQTGAKAAGNLSITDGGIATWDQSATDTLDAQLDAYINANDAKTYARANIDSKLPWLAAVIPVFVNESQTCNAYSNGDDIHFFVAGPSQSGSVTCSNTGRINDVLYHEFGHSLNANSLMGDWSQTDGAFGEGQADTYAQTMINSAQIGKGFFSNMLTTPIRDSDPVGSEFIYPQDYTGQEIHDAGRIFSGTMWDLRKALIAQYGYAAGRAKHDAIYYGIIQHSLDMTTTYAEALAANDDDGNLGNGTPDQCLIQTAFAAHGLATGSAVSGVNPPTRDGFTITVPLAMGNASCPPPGVSSMTVTWQLRETPTTMGTVQLAASGQSWTGVIPTQPDGSVVQYKVDIALASGSNLSYPDNKADPMYEFYVGTLQPIKCWDFETNPTDWTHKATTGTDEWQWGPPMGTSANTDPASAHGGSNVYGIDLGQNGGDSMYENNTDQSATSPVVDTTGYDNVRLQFYRWLNVEDANFDHATINVDGNQRWINFNSNMGNNSNTQHLDKEWRFQDVDLSKDAADNKVQVSFELSSDPGLTFGGWTVDDVCIMGHALDAQAVCGNGVVEAGEECDDGNTANGDGCSSTCQLETAGPGDTGCCSSTRTTAGGSLLLALGVLAVGGRRRSRKQR
jgi:cysteine-rich repeat protein